MVSKSSLKFPLELRSRSVYYSLKFLRVNFSAQCTFDRKKINVYLTNLANDKAELSRIIMMMHSQWQAPTSLATETARLFNHYANLSSHWFHRMNIENHWLVFRVNHSAVLIQRYLIVLAKKPFPDSETLIERCLYFHRLLQPRPQLSRIMLLSL